MKKQKIICAVVLSSVIAGILVSGVCFAAAGSQYKDSYEKCLADSGGRSDNHAVDYACGKASCKTAKDKESCKAAGGQNGCSLWIGSGGNSVSTTIYVDQPSGVVPIAFWGMCTDRLDTTAWISVTNDNDSINDGMNLTRGSWNKPRSTPTTLDVAKFIQGLAGTKLDACKTQYTRNVSVARAHSDAGSQDALTQPVTIVVLNGLECQPEEVIPPEDLCSMWAPASYWGSGDFHGTTSTIIKIKNLNPRFGGTGFGDWNADTIYAMPTDDIAWHTCYYPGVQTTAFQEVSEINGGSIYKGYQDLSTTSCQGVLPVNNQQLHAVSPIWENKYDLFGSDNGGATRGDTAGQSAATGDSNIMQSDNGRLTVLGDAGNTFTENSKTGQPIEAVITISNPSTSIYNSPCYDSKTGAVTGYNCYTCTNSYATPLYRAWVTYANDHKKVSVKVPYNFMNTTDVEVDEDMIYSGETITVNKVNTTVNPRYNGVTIANYATEVPNAQVKLYAYVSSNSGGQMGSFMSSNGNGCSAAGAGSKQCMEFGATGRKTLNPGASLSGDTENHSSLAKKYNAYDASAGDYMCFVSAVYPAEVSGDTDMSGGNGMWRYSQPNCTVIAKKPSFQVWGGSLYSKGSIDTYEGLKRNIYSNYYNSWNNLNKNGGFKKTGGGSTVIHFTPWVEESLILNTGTTKTVASGAATGKNSNPAGAGNTSDFCKDQAALTFANYSGVIGTLCNGSSSVGQSGLDNGIKDRDALISYWVGGADKGSCGSMWGGTCRNIESASRETIRYVSGGDMSIGTTTIPAATTYLVKSNGTVTITGDLKYQSGYTRLRDIPKVVIYARNVNIQCGVNEVDAIIITGNGGAGKVDTCSNASGGDSAHNRSRQLKIFGMVITDEIELGRTYGNAANRGGKTDPSGMPADGAAAEIFDFDTSILMWSEYMAGSAESDTLETVYQREVAPRY